jgi:5'-nucleotidase
VVVLSKNDADSGLRILSSAEAHGLDITRAAFTDGEDASRYLGAFECNLFLSKEAPDVRAAIAAGFPAAYVLDPPDVLTDEDPGPVRIAFDGDAVLFDDESERVYKEQGLEAFTARERELADVPLNPGPLEPFLRALAKVQSEATRDATLVRTSLVTARSAPAHERVVKTLRHWGVTVDESFFLGGVQKANVLNQLRPHIFFDDQRIHLDPARGTTPSAHVPSPSR